MADKKQFLYLLKPVRLEMLTKGATTDEGLVLEQHFDYLSNLADEGSVILFGRTQNLDETTFGLVIFETESKELANQIMTSDPAVKQHLMQATLFPYQIAGNR